MVVESLVKLTAKAFLRPNVLVAFDSERTLLERLLVVWSAQFARYLVGQHLYWGFKYDWKLPDEVADAGEILVAVLLAISLIDFIVSIGIIGVERFMYERGRGKKGEDEDVTITVRRMEDRPKLGNRKPFLLPPSERGQDE